MDYINMRSDNMILASKMYLYDYFLQIFKTHNLTINCGNCCMCIPVFKIKIRCLKLCLIYNTLLKLFVFQICYQLCSSIFSLKKVRLLMSQRKLRDKEEALVVLIVHQGCQSILVLVVQIFTAFFVYCEHNTQMLVITSDVGVLALLHL